MTKQLLKDIIVSTNKSKEGKHMEKYGLLGGSLGHSFSPRIHELLGGYQYDLYERTESELEDFFVREGLSGINVTIPYKKVIINYCDELSDAASRIGSVNTVVNRDGRLKGFNTDYAGFRYLLSSNSIDVDKKKVLVLGNGGAVRAVICALLDLGANEVIMLSRRVDGRSEIHEYEPKVGRVFSDSYENIENYLDIEVLVNTTPLGMFPGNGRTPAEMFGGSLQIFTKLQAVADIVYNPLRTELLLEAEDLGLKAANGLSMLVAQAACASLLFKGLIEDEKEAGAMDTYDFDIAAITDKLTFENSNIILIGMPGCGKSTYGKKLAEKYGRDFIDTDAEIVKLAGKSIPDIFSEDGEVRFRELETEVLRMACGIGGRVIATGGGVVTQKRNHHPLRENGLIIFLDRPIEGLDISGRPLSQTKGVEQLYKERLPLYRALADKTFDVTGFPDIEL